MSYEGGGGAQGPAGPTGATGATGATGGISFSGPNGAVLWYDGTGVTGTTGLTWTQTGGMGDAHRLFGGPNGNYLELDDGTGSMAVFVDQINSGHGLLLAAGATRITLTDATAGEEPTNGNLQIQINGSNGNNGEVLTSDGTYARWQPSGSLPHGIVNLTDLSWSQGPTGFYYSDFSIAPYTIYEGANVLTTMINAIDIQAAANCWIVNVSPNISTGLVRIWLASLPPTGESVDPLYASWLITDFGSAPPPEAPV